MKKENRFKVFFPFLFGLVFYSCSKKVSFMCESSFDNVKTTINVEGVGKSKPYITVVKDSILSANYSIGLSFYTPFFKIKEKQIKIKVSANEKSLGTNIDTVFNLDLTNKINNVILDFNYNFKDSTSSISIKRVGENIIFW